MKHYLIVGAILISLSQGYSQIDFADNNLNAPPSPNASGLLKYANIPVSLYSGTAEVNVPITNLPGRGISIPVSISYHSSGIKVQDIASWVGLGWSLNAGGVITRVLRGLSDEGTTGFCGANGIGRKAYLPLDPTYVANVASRAWDGEPDLFYFNFMGNTGKFILDEEGRAISLPYSGIQITPAIGPNGVGKWILTDAAGVKYTFGLDAFSVESSSTNKNNNVNTQTNYTSSWYLSTIVYPNGEIVSLTYSTGSSINYKYFVQGLSRRIHQTSAIGASCVTNPSLVTTNDNIETTISAPRYLSQITTSLGKIVFQPSAILREDLNNGKYLDQILVYDNSNNLTSSFKLNYSYFLSDGCSTELCKRLKLNNVSQIAGPQSIPMASFEYNSMNLPSRDSHAIDHWGFYNSNSFSSKIPSVTFQDATCGTITYSGANKEPDSTRVKSNILTKINLPTGGYQEFVYSINNYFDATSATNKVTGGVRIRQIIESSDGSNNRTTYFYYKEIGGNNSSGKIITVPVYHFTYSAGSLQYLAAYRDLRINSQSLTDLFDLNGYHVGYSNVTTKYSGNGYVESYFTNFSDHPDEPASQFLFQTSVEGSLAANEFPFALNTSKATERGLLVRKNVYNSSGKRLLSEETDFNFSISEIKRVPAYKSSMTDYYDTRQYQRFSVGKYYVVNKLFLLSKVTTITYDQSTGDLDLLTSSSDIKEFSLNTYNMLPTSVTTYNANQPLSKTITRISYATDYSYLSTTPPASSDVSALTALTQRNQVSLPIEKYIVLQENGISKVVSAQIIKYKRLGGTNDFITPYEIWNMDRPVDLTGVNAYVPAKINSNGDFIIDSRMRLNQSFTNIQATGNIFSTTRLNGETTNFSWDVATNSLLTSKTTNQGSPYQQQISFTYKPLVGVLTSTDANGRVNRFEYDEFNRLKITRDHDASILNRFRYHYKNATELFTSFSYTNTPYDNSVNFTATLPSEPGVQYIWDFGDGVVTPNGGSTIAHTYPNGGTYNVKLAAMHPEFPTAYATNTVGVIPSLSAAITGYGTYRYINTCTPTTSNFTATLTASPPGAIHYNWEFKYSTYSTWTATGTDSPSLTWGPSSVTTPVAYNVRCRLTDNNGNYRYSNTVTVDFWCPTGGGSGGGGNPSNGCATPNNPRPASCDSTCGWNGCTCSPCQ